MENEKIICADCGKECIPDGVGTGYGITSDTHKTVCYECCGKRDEKELMSLKLGEHYVLYLTKKVEEIPGGTETKWFLTNWPGTFRQGVWAKEGRHNIARVRRDVWFKLKDHYFHGTQYGNDSELCYITRVKPW